jgi:NADP-dependent 3-hydroxy acid dehydrogenase YdfG
MQKITGRVAVVTGAASGIGRATAKHMIERGCAVAAADIDAGGLATLADEVGRSGGTLSTHLVDVANRSQMAVLPERVLAEHGHVHILVNNAGVALGQTVEDLSWEDFDWLVGINFWGVVHGCKFFLPYLQREEEAHIANISSMFGFAGLPTQGPYCATKAAVRSFSETLHAELGNSKVGVTSVHPGGIKTNIVRHARFEDTQARDSLIESFERRGAEPEVVARRIVRAIEVNRLRLLITPESRALDFAKRVLPTGTQRLVRRLWSRSRSTQPQ